MLTSNGHVISVTVTVLTIDPNGERIGACVVFAGTRWFKECAHALTFIPR